MYGWTLRQVVYSLRVFFFHLLTKCWVAHFFPWTFFSLCFILLIWWRSSSTMRLINAQKHSKRKPVSTFAFHFQQWPNHLWRGRRSGRCSMLAQAISIERADIQDTPSLSFFSYFAQASSLRFWCLFRRIDTPIQRSMEEKKNWNKCLLENSIYLWQNDNHEWHFYFGFGNYRIYISSHSRFARKWRHKQTDRQTVSGTKEATTGMCTSTKIRCVFNSLKASSS